MENSAKNTGNEQAYAVAYLRLSKQDKECGIPESDSIESQRLIISQYCAQNGLTIVGEYVDDGASGKNFERENFSRMLVELPKTRAKYIITKDLSRLGRTIESLKVIKEQFASLGVIYIAINDGYDSRKPDPSLPIRLSLNQLQLEDTAQKVAAALDARRKEGRYCAPPPYGYIRNPRNRSQIIPNEDTAPIVRRIFERAAAGHSKRRIARDLTADRIPTPSMYNVLQHMDERDGITVSRTPATSWSAKTVARILEDPTYLGNTYLGRSRTESLFTGKKRPIPKEDWIITNNTHPAIVSEEEFAAAKRNRGRSECARKNSDSKSETFLSAFSGILFCGLCGSAMCLKRPSATSPKPQWQLDCLRHRNDIPNPCCGSPIYYAALEEAVKSFLNERITLSDKEISRIVDSCILNDAERLTAKKEIKNLESIIAISRAKINKALESNVKGVLSGEECDALIAKAQAEIIAANGSLQKMCGNPAFDDAEKRENIEALVRSYCKIDDLDRETLSAYVDRIEVFPRILPNGVQKLTHPNKHPFEQDIHIYLRFSNEF